MPPKMVVKEGQRFHRLVVVRELERDVYGKRRFLFRCSCGSLVSTNLTRVTTGRTRSCGCYKIERGIEANTVHGVVGHPLYVTWKGMMARCYNPRHGHYKSYGARGIRVCREWHDPNAFIRWNASLPKSQRRSSLRTLDRRDNDGDYTPDNCRWVIQRAQCRNTRFNRVMLFKGKDRKAIDVYEYLKKQGMVVVSYVTFWARINGLGWSIHDACSTPVR